VQKRGQRYLRAFRGGAKKRRMVDYKGVNIKNSPVVGGAEGSGKRRWTAGLLGQTARVGDAKVGSGLADAIVECVEHLARLLDQLEIRAGFGQIRVVVQRVDLDAAVRAVGIPIAEDMGNPAIQFFGHDHSFL